MSRYVIIATAGRPVDWSVVKYDINGETYVTCASFIALAEYLRCRSDNNVDVIVIFPDSVDRRDVKCLREEFHNHGLKNFKFIFAEIEGNIRGLKFLGELYAIPSIILCVSSIYYLEGSKIVFDLTHGWNILPSLAMYCISLIKGLIEADVYIAEPCIVRTRARCGEDCLSNDIDVTLRIHKVDMPIFSKLYINISKVRETIDSISKIIPNVDKNMFHNIVNCVECLSSGVITLGWYYLYKIFNDSNNRRSIDYVENQLKNIIQILLEEELSVPEDVTLAHMSGRRVVNGDFITYRKRCSREGLFQLLYEILRFIIIIRILKKLGYYGDNVPGLSISFNKLQELLKELKNTNIMDKPTYLVTFENLRGVRRECSRNIKDFCEHIASKLGIDREKVDVIACWDKEDREKVCRNVVAHSGFTCPIVKECSINELKVNRDIERKIEEFGNKLVEYLLKI